METQDGWKWVAVLASVVAAGAILVALHYISAFQLIQEVCS